MIRFDIEKFFKRKEIRNIKLTTIEDFKTKIVLPRGYNNIQSCHYIEIDFDGKDVCIDESKLDWDVIENNKCYGGYIFKLKDQKGYWIYERPNIIDYFKKMEEEIAENIRLKTELYLVQK